MKSVGTINILRNDKVTLHSYMCPEDGEMVCSQVIETENKLVIVDVQLLRPYAQELREYVNRLNKPIDRVIITHSHPDHWFGLEFFNDIPIYSLPETINGIEQMGDMLLGYKKAELGALIADNKVVPSNIIKEGIENIDGLKFKFTKVIDGEAPVMLLIELPDLKAVVAQDLVYNHIYLVVGEKNSQGEYLFDGWIRALESLREKEYNTVLAGHGAPTDSTIFPELIEYIGYAKQLFESGVGEVELKQKLIEKYPTYRITQMLDFANVFLYHRTW